MIADIALRHPPVINVMRLFHPVNRLIRHNVRISRLQELVPKTFLGIIRTGKQVAALPDSILPQLCKQIFQNLFRYFLILVKVINADHTIRKDHGEIFERTMERSSSIVILVFVLPAFVIDVISMFHSPHGSGSLPCRFLTPEQLFLPFRYPLPQ